MNFYETLNSASRVSEVIGDQTRRHNEMFAAAQAEHKRQEKIGNAQLDSAEDLRRMLEMMEANQKEQAIESKKTKIISIWGAYHQWHHLGSHHTIWNTTSDTLIIVTTMLIRVIVVVSQPCLRGTHHSRAEH